MVGREGIEPSTTRLKVGCSTAELPAHPQPHRLGSQGRNACRRNPGGRPDFPKSSAKSKPKLPLIRLFGRLTRPIGAEHQTNAQILDRHVRHGHENDGLISGRPPQHAFRFISWPIIGRQMNQTDAHSTVPASLLASRKRESLREWAGNAAGTACPGTRLFHSTKNQNGGNDGPHLCDQRNRRHIREKHR